MSLPPLRSSLCLGVILLLIPIAPSAHAETVDVVGADGIAGAAGASGNPGGAGGNGGAGEDALAAAGPTMDDDTASATGGTGGDGGSGGSGSQPGADGGAGGNGGAGGDATSTAIAIDAQARANATGGDGGAAGAGGSADPIGTPGTDGTAGAAGTAIAGAEASSAGSGPLLSVAIARGGAGGNAVSGQAADGGTASATASATSTGGGFTAARAEIYGGAGGDALSPEAAAGNGADAISIDAASVSTSGQLGVSILAEGGAGGGGFAGAAAGDGGHASGGLHLDHDGTGMLTLHVTTVGGQGGSSSKRGGIGGTATVSDVAVAASAGADVSLTGSVRGGDGGDSLNGTPGEGTSARIENAVAATTSGDSILRQLATGGSGGVGKEGALGAAGGATNLLEFETTAADLFMYGASLGGTGAREDESSGIATTRLSATNHDGSALARSRADGGDSDPTSPGGFASSESFARTTGSGEAETDAGADGGNGATGGAAHTTSEAVSEASGDATAYGTATGGSAFARETSAARGGDASVWSTSRAMDSGGSRSQASATGGQGSAIVNDVGLPAKTGVSGAGSDASAIALATGRLGGVDALAIAVAGSSGTGGMRSGNGGNSYAEATGRGFGSVSARATAIRVDAPGAEHGRAIASSRATGTSGGASAEAYATPTIEEDLYDSNTAYISSSVSAGGFTLERAARVELLSAVPLPAALPLDDNSRMSAVTQPTAADRAAALAANTALADAFASNQAEMKVLGRLDVRSDESGVSSFSRIELAFPEAEEDQQVIFAVLGLYEIGDGVSEVSVSFRPDTSPLLRLEFDDFASIESFFTNRLFTSSADLTNSIVPDFSVFIGVDLDPGAQFGLEYAIALVSLPEPGTGVLIAGALLVLCSRRSPRP